MKGQTNAIAYFYYIICFFNTKCCFWIM